MVFLDRQVFKLHRGVGFPKSDRPIRLAHESIQRLFPVARPAGIGHQSYRCFFVENRLKGWKTDDVIEVKMSEEDRYRREFGETGDLPFQVRNAGAGVNDEQFGVGLEAEACRVAPMPDVFQSARWNCSPRSSDYKIPHSLTILMLF